MITPTFKLENGESHTFEVDPERRHDSETPVLAFWTALEYQQCLNCPLSRDEYKNCPLAADLKEVFERFSKIQSWSGVEGQVETEARTYTKVTDVQTGLDALLGLIMATSGCPILGKFKTMARTHLPFSTQYESMPRSVGTYLLEQYFVMQDGKDADWELKGLIDFYEGIMGVNDNFADRVRTASEKDAGVNAIVQLASRAISMSYSIEEQLADYKREFLP